MAGAGFGFAATADAAGFAGGSGWGFAAGAAGLAAGAGRGVAGAVAAGLDGAFAGGFVPEGGVGAERSSPMIGSLPSLFGQG
jgi:hypothetical protein